MLRLVYHDCFGMLDVTAQFRERFSARLIEREPMARHTNFRVGGPARWYCDARSAEDIADAVRIAQDGDVPWLVVGGGSNMLVADRGYDGLVIQVAVRDIAVDGTRVAAGAGAITAAVARAAGDAGCVGFEWAISLPGTIGGAVRGNAGCFGGEMRLMVDRVHVFDAMQRSFRELQNAECEFAYRSSMFKKNAGLVVVRVVLSLQAGDARACQERMAVFLAQRRAKQPLERPSAGCLFTNVLVEDLNADAVSHLDGAGDWRSVVHDGQLPAGWLIEQLRMKGLRVGGAQVSAQHGNFVVNLGGATAADIAALSVTVQAKAQEVFGIALHEEVQRVGFQHD